MVCLLLSAFLLPAGVPLVPDVLTIAGFTACAEGVPGFVGFSAVALIRAVAGFLLLMAPLLLLASLPILASLSYCSW